MARFEVDVVVVGGGFAGVTAARDLSHRGLRVAVLEARDRLGGRTWTKSDADFGGKIEMGGTYIHWLQPHVWSEITAAGLGISPTTEFYDARWIVDGTVVESNVEELFGGFAQGVSALIAPATEAFPLPFSPFPLTEQAVAADQRPALQVAKELGLPTDAGALLRAYVDLTFNGDVQVGSYAHMLRLASLVGGDWARLIETMGGYTITHGTKALLEAIHATSQAQVHLQTVVEAIADTADGVTVTTTGGDEFDARAAVVTAPVQVLRDIRFDPPLAEGHAAMAEQGQVSHGTKVWLRVKGQIDPFIAWAPEGSPLTMMGYEWPAGDDSVLLAFGSDADRVDVTDPASVQAAARQWFPDLEVIAVHAHDWTADPYSKSTWFNPAIGQTSSYLADFLRPHGHTWFAGADYAQGWAGFIDGAIESGRATATTLAAHLQS